MVLYTWWEVVYFWFMIMVGLFAVIMSLLLFRLSTWDKWYVAFKGVYGAYMAVIFYLVWSPYYLNDPWLTRQCVRGVIVLAGLTLFLDLTLGWTRRKLR